MKAITIWQPWASLIACGAKRYETRGWATRYCGPIAIHAAVKNPYEIDVNVWTVVSMTHALQPHYPGLLFGALPRGAIIATAELVGCYRIVAVPDGYAEAGIPGGMDSMPYNTPDPSGPGICGIGEKEVLFGDWTPGRYAWRLENVKMLPEPIPAKGRQGLWNWEGSRT